MRARKARKKLKEGKAISNRSSCCPADTPLHFILPTASSIELKILYILAAFLNF